jgi:hypothetical protein
VPATKDSCLPGGASERIFPKTVIKPVGFGGRVSLSSVLMMKDIGAGDLFYSWLGEKLCRFPLI